MAEATMAVTARERAKGAARAERRAGRIPAVIYGGKAHPVKISVEPCDLQREMTAGNCFRRCNARRRRQERTCPAAHYVSSGD